MKLIAVVLAAAVLVFPGFGHAQHSGHGMAAAADAVHQASGKVTKVDRSAGRVTIAHGPVASLKWPAMTMAFEVRDKALFDKMLEFSFVEQNRKHVVTGVK
jgi:Cu(I)/Ag(I) efflux system protein CusF